MIIILNTHAQLAKLKSGGEIGLSAWVGNRPY